MSDKKCTSCSAPLAEEGSTAFACPACGVEITRCYPVQGAEYSLRLPEMRIRGTVRHGERSRNRQGHPEITGS